MGYNKGLKNSTDTKPVVLDEQKNRRYRLEIEKNLEIIQSHRKELSTLQSEKANLEKALKEIYDKHKVEVANLYNKLGQDKKDFQIKCRQWEELFATQQKRIDEQKTELETERISIADDKKDLIEKENKLITLSNDIIGQQQTVDNQEEYLQSVSQSIDAQKQEIALLKEGLDEKILEHSKLIKQKEELESSLEIRIKQHDARLDEVNAQIREMKKYIEEYKEIQASVAIAKSERDELNVAIKQNREYAATLKQLEIDLKDKAQKLAIQTKAAWALDKELKERLSHVKILERTHLKEG